MGKGKSLKFRAIPKLRAYIKNRLGHVSEPGCSLYELGCKALAKDGLPKPEDASARGWVGRNMHVVMAFYVKIKHDESDEWVKAVTTKPQSKTNPKGDSFLTSYEWRKLRMQALKKYGPRCMCCGATPASGATMNVDHIKPRKLVPHLALDIENLQILCGECNHGKGNWDQTDWRPQDNRISFIG
jgi:hypothetical protein